jgi:DNA-binding beta-propeller fold protein YncE
MTFSSDGRYAFVLSSHDRDLIFIGCAERRVIARVSLDARQSGLSDPAPSRLESAAADGSSAEETDATRRGYRDTATEPLPEGEVVLTPDGKTLLTSTPQENEVKFVNVPSRSVVASVTVGERPSALAVLPDNSKLFVAETGERKISAIDVATRQVLSHLEIGVTPGPMLVKPDGGELFILSPASFLVIVDAFHDNVEQDFPLGRAPVAGILKGDSGVLYVADASDGSVMAIDIQNRRALSSTQTGGSSRSLALTPDGRFLAVADGNTSSLAILRTALMDTAGPASARKERSALLTTIPVGSDPVDVLIEDWVWSKSQ